MPTSTDVAVEQVKARLKQIEDLFSQDQRLVAELERLRNAILDLEHMLVSYLNGGLVAGQRGRASSSAGAKRPTASARTPRGHNKAKILHALQGHESMTASEIAKVTDIAAATVSTTLTKMAKTGELAKAKRGYTLPR